MENLSLESSSFSEFFKTEPDNSNVNDGDVKVFYEISHPKDVSSSCSGSESEFVSFLRCDEVIDYDAEENLSIIQQKDIERHRTSKNANDGSKIHVKNEVTTELETGTDPTEEYVLSDIPSFSANISSKYVPHQPVASNKQIPHRPEKTPTSLRPKSSHPFACKLCARQFKSEPELKIHVTLCGLYHNDRDRLCVPCHRVFSTPSLRERHNFNIHKIVTSRFKNAAAKLVEFKCHICPKKYPSKNLLLTHIESHKTIQEQHRPFKCPVPKCPSSFLRKSSLTSHAKTHSNTKPFKCPHPGCDHKFKFKFSIREHFLTHADAGPRMKCPFPNCYYSFNLIARLNRHVKNFHKDNVCET